MRSEYSTAHGRHQTACMQPAHSHDLRGSRTLRLCQVSDTYLAGVSIALCGALAISVAKQRNEAGGAPASSRCQMGAPKRAAGGAAAAAAGTPTSMSSSLADGMSAFSKKRPPPAPHLENVNGL